MDRLTDIINNLKSMSVLGTEWQTARYGFVQFNLRHAPEIGEFLDDLFSDLTNHAKQRLPLLFDEESDVLHLEDFDDLEKGLEFVKSHGVSNLIKMVYIGDHAYRHEAEKCNRCYRHRFEVAYDLKHNVTDQALCDRCHGVINPDYADILVSDDGRRASRKA